MANSMIYFHNGGTYNKESLKMAVEPFTLAVQVPKFELLLIDMLK
jgi:hypothetical protein